MILMGMEKAIASGKEHRKEYHGAKAICKSCRNGGSCEWCQMNRQYKNLKKMQISIDKELKECYNEYNKKKRK